MPQPLYLFMVYPCCEVSRVTTREELCWVCEEAKGVAYYDDRDRFEMYRSGGTCVRFSEVKLEYLKLRHP